MERLLKSQCLAEYQAHKIQLINASIVVGHEMTLKRKRMKTKNFLPGVSHHPRSLSMNGDIVSSTGVTAKGSGYL